MLAGFFFLSVIIAFAVTKLSIRLCLRWKILDLPIPRSSHSNPVPRIGGTGILAGFCISLITLYAAGLLGFVWKIVNFRDLILIISVSVGMAIIGLYDDLRGLTPAVKMSLQLPIAVLVFACGISIDRLSLPYMKPIALGVFALPLTVLWLVGFANIFNFMDGINGLAGGTGVIYGAFFSLFAWRQGDPEFAAIALLLAGSSLGFLFHNFPRPHTFMGDTGSMFLGTLLALLVVKLGQGSRNPASLGAMILICSVYLYDSGFTLLRRLWRRENIFRAHRSHLYQRLVRAGLSHAKVTGLYLAGDAAVGSLALAYVGDSEAIRLEILTLVCLGFCLFAVGVARIEQRIGA